MRTRTKITRPGKKNKTIKKGRFSGTKKGQVDRFGSIEELGRIQLIENIAAQGTHKAYIRAVKNTNVIVQVRDGNLVREVKGSPVQILSTLGCRTVEKGQTLSINLNK